MEFTRAHIPDLPELIESRMAYLHADIGAITPAQEAETRRRLVPFFKDHLDRDLFVFCAKVNGRMVGAAYLMVYEKPFRPECTTARYGVVFNVVTREGYRGKGIATALVRQLVAAARDMALESVLLNATPSGRPIYKRLGFEEKALFDMNMVYDLTK